MQTPFTPVSAALGGIAIGAAATLLYAGIGRIAGISGILNTGIEQRDGRAWRLLFLAGLVAGAGLWFAFGTPPAALRSGFPLAWLIVAGLLVGAGTRLGSGCTSGHGVCGLARLSPRSLVAVVVFMGCGAVTVSVLRHLVGVLP